MKIKSLHLARNSRRGFTFPACILIALAISACGAKPKVSVALMPDFDQKLESGKTLPISATLLNDAERKGVTWTLSGPGTLVAKTSTSVMYQAPSTIGAQESITVTAT